MLINLDRQSETPLFEQLYSALKEQILKGELANDEKLPSKRQLKADLSISQTTIEHAYNLLLDEDLIYSREKSGFYVSAIEQLKQVASATTPEIRRPEKKSYTLPLGTIDTTLVQSDVLKQIAREVYSDDELLNKGEESGETVLKEQIRHYLNINRGVTCSTDQIFIGPSTEFLLEQLMYLLQYPEMTIEDPGYPVIRKVLERLDSGTDAAQVLEDGIDVDQVADLANPVVHVTPSHQFPSGAVMSLQKRIQLLNHASSNDRFIIEDDYDSEFRYTGRPLPSLQGLDQNDRTIYMSTFSKSLYPSLRLSCMVLPASLAELYYEKELSCNVPRQMQHIVARFMEQGYLTRHINRMRKVYRKKMEAITTWIAAHHDVEIHGEHTGMHFIIRIPGMDLEEAADNHRLVHGNVYSYERDLGDTIIVGIGEKDTREIIDILDRFLEEAGV
ncbi:PLP-dependent aminotransferase family protein [Salinicoccus roseus]|uniref:MocR-like pyridoxine biosynthesis transcription factor PdxR n=1 Tax=Salinicoccus roseus TaxID=45670 RepID=UPI000F4FCA68|nr:PLP-dependent aminotransferase family protein [Salinicoccus roseus]RPE53029.1 GntR family transcriptional regulator/MocR family aminotransferase [Salinicoccus roseus]GGA71428.1 GntR family transcriptional regulator [Salinicoccus roseus]